MSVSSSVSRPAQGGKPRVLFVNTRSALGADVAVHLTLIQHFHADQAEIYFATNRNSRDLQKTLEAVDGLQKQNILVLDLGHEFTGQGRGKIGKITGGLKNAGAFVSLCRLALFVRQHKIDVLHATDRPRDAGFSTLLAKLTGRRNLLHIHIKWSSEMGRLTNWSAGACSGVLAISHFVHASLIAGGMSEHKIYTAHNATDTVRFDPEKTQGGLLRKRFELTDDTPLIGIVARIMVWKGHLDLIEAMAKVVVDFPEARLAIVGLEDALGAQGVESYADQVRRRSAELGLQKHILWAGWHDAMPQVMADLDVLAMPSWEEPFGLVVTEGMSMQLPIVGYRSGALPEIVTDGVEGLLVSPKDTDRLAEALIALLRDPKRRAEMGRRGRERVLREFTPARQCARVVDIYRRVIKGEPDYKPDPSS